MMETIHSEAIANRTYSLTAYSTPKLRHTDYHAAKQKQSPPPTQHKQQQRRSSSLLLPPPPSPSVSLTATTTAAVSDDTSTAASATSAWCDITQLRCRTNAMFTKFSCSYVSWSFSSSLTRLTTHHYPQSQHHFHPKHFSLSYSQQQQQQRNWLLVPLVLLSLLSNHRLAMANPINQAGASTSSGDRHWMNPCNLNLKSVNSEETGPVYVDLKGLFHKISKSALVAKDRAEQAKTQFVEETFGDPSFMLDFEWISYNWLPKIPSISEHHFKNIDTADLLRKSYEYMQHYAVAIDQMVMDQILYDGNYVDKFRKMEDSARSVLCPLHQTILELKIKPNRDVTKDIMSEEYRSNYTEVTRNVRDYIILRDFIAGLNYIHHAFHYKHAEVAEDDAAT